VVKAQVLQNLVNQAYDLLLQATYEMIKDKKSSTFLV